MATADLLYSTVAAIGETAIVAALRPYAPTLRIVGAVVLLAVAGYGLLGVVRAGEAPAAPLTAARTYGGSSG